MKQHNCRISVRGLRTETRINDIFEVFQDFGTITACRLITDKRNESKGYCFICYSTPEEADIAIHSMDGKRFDGAVMNCVYAALQNEMKFDDPELKGVKVPPSRPEGRGPPSLTNWERNFKYVDSSSSESNDEADFAYNNTGEPNIPPILPLPPQITSTKISQPQIPPPPRIPPPPGFIPPPPPSLISQQKIVPPPPPLSLITQQQNPPTPQQSPPPPQVPIRPAYQIPPPPPAHSPTPPQSIPSTASPRPPVQYQPPSRQPYRSHDYNNYGPSDDYSYEQEFQREHQFRSSGGANSRMDEQLRYQYYPSQDSRYPPQDSRYPPPDPRYPPHPNQRPPPGNYGRPLPPPPPHLPPPSHRQPPPLPDRLYQGHRQDRQPQPPRIPPPPPMHPNHPNDLYFESD